MIGFDIPTRARVVIGCCVGGTGGSVWVVMVGTVVVVRMMGTVVVVGMVGMGVELGAVGGCEGVEEGGE